jgi:hypothetical protein
LVIGSSIFLNAIGVSPRFAITATLANVNLQTVGVILMIVGIVGLVLSVVFWSSWGVGWGRRRSIVDRPEGRIVSRHRDDPDAARDERRAVRDDRYHDIDKAA